MEHVHAHDDNTHAHPAPAATPASGPIVQLTDKAVEMVKEAMIKENLDGHSLRVAVVGGGCSGYQYGLDFDKEPGEDDVILEQGGLKIFVDQYSAGYLNGTQIDYVTGLSGAGFKFNNPTAKKTCGCGSSFSA